MADIRAKKCNFAMDTRAKKCNSILFTRSKKCKSEIKYSIKAHLMEE